METVILICCAAIIIMLAVLISMINNLIQNSTNVSDKTEFDELKKQIDFLSSSNSNQNKTMLDQSVRQSEMIIHQITILGDSLRSSINIQQENQQLSVNEKLTKLENDFDKIQNSILIMLEKIRSENQTSLDKINDSVSEKLQASVNEKLTKLENDFDKIQNSILTMLEKIRSENQTSLDKINDTVNEKLQKSLDDRISRSFAAVNTRLTEVYEGLGEMKAVASGVSDLKNVLSNVKTRGIMGEIQLGALLDEMLSREQYEEQAQLVPKSSERVDFAVKLPGSSDGEYIYLPVDSKFPAETYSNLLAAYESGNPEELKSKRSLLTAEIKRCAKSIHDKYIKPPYTTDFAVMFLPFEGLYAEVINLGLVEVLQREYKINIAGPSTMGAMLNSFQMGFRTLAIQKKSGEVWKILESAKKEFGNFEKVLTNTRNRLRQADEELDKLIGTRTNMINRALKNIALADSENNED